MAALYIVQSVTPASGIIYKSIERLIENLQTSIETKIKSISPKTSVIIPDTDGLHFN
jgi:hypothetical protein